MILQTFSKGRFFYPDIEEDRILPFRRVGTTQDPKGGQFGDVEQVLMLAAYQNMIEPVGCITIGFYKNLCNSFRAEFSEHNQCCDQDAETAG